MKRTGPRIGPLPLIVGITGHRDLSEAARAPAEKAVRSLLTTLRATYPHTPVHVMSGAAEGADQLACQVALDMGLPVIVTLPMPLDDYATTMSDDAARAGLSSIVDRAVLTVTLPPPLAGAPEGVPSVTAYEQLGLYLARISHILVALWDGVPHSGEAHRGGSAHVVAMRMTPEAAPDVAVSSPLHPAGLDELDMTDPGPTLRLGVSRADHPNDGSLGRLFDARETDGAALTDIAATVTVDSLARLDQANRRLAMRGRAKTRRIDQGAASLIPDGRMQAEPTARRAALDVLRRARATAALGAARYQTRTYRVHAGLVAALPAAVLTFEVYSHLYQDITALSAYLAIVAGAFLFHYGVSARLEWQAWYQDLRALAEALRVQAFWGLAGIPTPVSECYLRKHRADLAWIRDAVRGLSPWGLSAAVSGPPRVEAVTDLWVRKQATFFGGADGHGGAAHREQGRTRRFDRLTTIAYLSGLGVGLALLAWELYPLVAAHGADGAHAAHGADAADAHSGHGGHGLGFGLAVTLMGLAPAFAGAFSVYAEKRAFMDHAHQYHRMGAVFRRALAILTGPRGQDTDRAQRVLRELGREALGENGDWLLAHRDRPIEPIKGG
ncbi:hypothetical protein [Rhodospira trueperi]|uniref:SMODS and SLOG-associating 2TM effector domain-containing protein n=1 Tax=Rhodospira trueperi TaxID=69960 RepID=A0A1G7I0G0_9PROT|nr:hypothetical protein [Rhodospira trueperi]SDF06231.1 hypothetical protein SAMN05421720_1286 [Rhodospira trueperi]